jgi:hypothetical protein
MYKCGESGSRSWEFLGQKMVKIAKIFVGLRKFKFLRSTLYISSQAFLKDVQAPGKPPNFL